MEGYSSLFKLLDPHDVSELMVRIVGIVLVRSVVLKMAADYDFMNSLLDEIALEGLDGITLQMLWKRIADRPRFPIPVDEDSKKYFWNQIAKHKEIEVYKLSKPRKFSPVFNRYDNIDDKFDAVVEIPEKVPDPYLPILPVKDGNIRGSCSDYKSRKCITSEIRNGNILQSLSQAMEEWGDSLVFVASPKIRLLSLIGTETDPLIDMNLEEYCLLERIGRSRYLGDVLQGGGSLLATESCFCKELHYYLKKLTAKGLVTKQQLIMRNKEGNLYIGCLFHLKRFYNQRKVTMAEWMKRLCDILKGKPQKREACRILKKEVGISDKTLRILTNRMFEKWVKFTTVPYREFYPDGSRKELYSLKGQEKMIKVAQLTRHYDEDSEQEDENENHEKDENLPLNVYFDASKIYYGSSLVYQLYSHIQKAGPEGICSSDLGRKMTLPSLDIHSLLRVLSKNGCIFTIFEAKGKPKVKKYIAEIYANENKHYSDLKNQNTRTTAKSFQQNNRNVYSDLVKCKAIATDERENEILACKYSDNEINALSETDEDLTTDKNGFNMNILEYHNIESNVRKLQGVSHSTKKPLGSEIFHNEPSRYSGTVPLTDRKQKRLKTILDHLKCKHFTTRFELHKHIIKMEREENYNFKLDIRSLTKLVNELHDSKKLKIIRVDPKLEHKLTKIEFICDNSTTASDPEIQNAVEKAKLKFIGIPEKDDQKIQSTNTRNYSFRYQSNKSGIITGENGAAEKMPKTSLSLQHSKEMLKDHSMEPKFERAKILHTFLYYLVYEHKSGPIISDQQCVYHQSRSWKRFVPPLPNRDRDGWCLMADICSRIPLSLFIKIIDLTENIPGLTCFLKDNEKAHYLIKYLPRNLRDKFMDNRKYLFFIMDVIKVLCHMGLISLGPQIDVQRNQVFLYVHRHVSIKDTTASISEHLNVENMIKTKHYKFVQEKDVEIFWLDLKKISLHSPITEMRSKIRVEEFFNRKLTDTTKNKNFDEVKDDGIIPGDGLGVGGFDSSLFLHCKQNWQYVMSTKSCEKTLVTCDKVHNASGSLKSIFKNTEIKKFGIQTNLQRQAVNSLFMQKHKIEVNRKDNQPEEGSQKEGSQLGYGNGPKSNCREVSREKKQNQKIGRDERENQQENYFDNENNDYKVSSVMEDSSERKKKPKIEQPSKKRKATELKTVENGKSKKRIRYLDEKDKAALKKKVKVRCRWSSPEDSFLLLCRVVSCFLDPIYCKNMVIPYTAVRDLLHEHVPDISKDKNSRACERRIRYMISNPVTVSNINMFLTEALEDTALVNEFSQPKPPKSKKGEWIDMFTRVLTELQKKFTSFSFGQRKKIVIPNSLQEFYERFCLKYSDLKGNDSEPFYKEPEEVENVKEFVLATLVFSRLASMDDDTYVPEPFKKLYQLYPRKALRSVIAHLRKRRIISEHKAPYHGSERKSNPYKFSNIYNFGMLTKFSKKNFKESQFLLDVLSSAGSKSHVELMGDVPSGYSAAVISLTTREQLCLHTKLPPQAILFNTSLSEEMKTEIVERMINTLKEDQSRDIISDDEDISFQSGRVEEDMVKSRYKDVGIIEMEKRSRENLSSLNSSHLSEEQLFINASRLALCLLRHESSLLPYEKVRNAQDCVVISTCQVYCHLTHNKTPDLPTIPPHVIETRFSERKENGCVTETKGELTEDQILEISKTLTYFLPSGASLTNQNFADQIKIMYKQYSPKTYREAKSIFYLIYVSGVMGVSEKALWRKFSTLLGEFTLFKHLKILRKANHIIRVGVVTFTYVCTCFAKDWALVTNTLSKSYYNEKIRINNDDISQNPNILIVSHSEVDYECDSMQTSETNSTSFAVQNTCITKEDTVDNPAVLMPSDTIRNTLSGDQKTEKSYFIPRTWRHLDGNLNKPVFFSLLLTVLSHVISVPGISSVQMCEKFSLIPPVQILELIEILEKTFCVYRYFCKSKKASLFSSMKTVMVTIYPHPDDTEHLEPFPDAICKIACFRNAMNF
ncbi:general transcription factor 3C polypeptide 1 [Nephila pilipes]|uniref:General transcription factor 3C polypeptide 1 n=1 Tax=Nephila pilipes TaxID=299642 RepID=A0A8X6TIJ7_NEPPI|nr:general transcription factor 3C polypeptide 1 [Nephila pilipes]